MFNNSNRRTGQHGTSAGQSLDDGETESLLPTGKNQSRCPGVQEIKGRLIHVTKSGGMGGCRWIVLGKDSWEATESGEAGDGIGNG